MPRNLRKGLLSVAATALIVGMSGMTMAQDGRVSVYTAHKAEIIERLIPEFEKATGLTADIVKAGSGDIINRVRAESANPQADVIWSIGAELLEANGFGIDVAGDQNFFCHVLSPAVGP